MDAAQVLLKLKKKDSYIKILIRNKKLLYRDLTNIVFIMQSTAYRMFQLIIIYFIQAKCILHLWH